MIDSSNVKLPKKRGRKPKGGKIVEIKDILVTNIPKPNVILHLNCFLHEITDIDFIKYKPDIEKIDTYNLHETNNFINFNFIKNNDNDISYNNIEKKPITRLIILKYQYLLTILIIEKQLIEN